jgi:recombination protein RecA
VKVVKNKMAPPFREVEFDILYGQGISRSGEVVDIASDLNLVQKSGAWYAVGNERIGQGRDNARQYLEEHPELMGQLEDQILAYHKIKRGGDASPAAPASTSSKSDVAPKPDKAEKADKGDADEAKSNGKAAVAAPQQAAAAAAKRAPRAN